MKKSIQEKTLSLLIKKFDKDFTDRHQESEQYVALQNRNIGKLSGWNNAEVSNEAWEVLVKVTNKQHKKTIYRRAVGNTLNDFTTQDIMIGYRSMKQLQVVEGSKVIVQPTNWFCYLWNHAQSPIRYPFRIAVIMGLVSILVGIVSLALSVCQLCNCCL